MKGLTSTLLLCCTCILLSAQNVQIELDSVYQDRGFNYRFKSHTNRKMDFNAAVVAANTIVLPTYKSGAEKGYFKVSYEFYSKKLHLKKACSIQLHKRYIFINQTINEGKIAQLFVASGGKYTLVILDSANGYAIQKRTGKFSFSVYTAKLHLQGNWLYCGVASQNEAELHAIPFDVNKEPKNLQKIKGRRPWFYTIQSLNDQTLVSVHLGKNKVKTNLLLVDKGAEIIQEHIIELPDGKMASNVSALRTSAGELKLFGAYSTRFGEYISGVFNANLVNGQLEQLNFTSFEKMSLHHGFGDYLEFWAGPAMGYTLVFSPITVSQNSVALTAQKWEKSSTSETSMDMDGDMVTTASYHGYRIGEFAVMSFDINGNYLWSSHHRASPGLSFAEKTNTIQIDIFDDQIVTGSVLKEQHRTISFWLEEDTKNQKYLGRPDIISRSALDSCTYNYPLHFHVTGALLIDKNTLLTYGYSSRLKSSIKNDRLRIYFLRTQHLTR